MIRTLINALKRVGLLKEECHVKHCHNRDIEEFRIKALDPIDHEDTVAKLCPEHREWAEGRNSFAENMYDELRDARKDIGMEHIDEIQKWTYPQGKIRKDILDGSVKEGGPRYMTLADALEGNR
jgi:hypothetical protein